VPQNKVLFLCVLAENNILGSSASVTFVIGTLSPVSMLSSTVQLPEISAASHSMTYELPAGNIITSPGTSSFDGSVMSDESRNRQISLSE